jgi:hypothetical protein
MGLPSGMTNLPMMLELAVATTKSTVSDCVTLTTPVELDEGLLSMTNVKVVFFADATVCVPLYVAGVESEIVMTSPAFKPWAEEVVAVTVPLVVDMDDRDIGFAN